MAEDNQLEVVEAAVSTLLGSLKGEDVNRQGLVGTPNRVARMYKEIFSGYEKDPEELFKAKFDTDNDNMVIIRDIDYWSHCEHHMVPFFGKVHIAYIPGEKVLGLSKFGRLVEIFSRRLQIQEQMTFQIADAIQKYLKPAGLMVVVEGMHMCMVMRGVKKTNSTTVTSYVKGAFKENAETRNEALKLFKI